MDTWNRLVSHRVAQRVARLVVLVVGLVSVSGLGITATHAAGSGKWVGTRTSLYTSSLALNGWAGVGLHDGRYATLSQPGAELFYSYSSVGVPHALVCVYYKTATEDSSPYSDVPATIKVRVRDTAGRWHQTTLAPLIVRAQSKACAAFGGVAIADVGVELVDGPPVHIDAIEGYVGAPWVAFPHTNGAER